VGDWAGEELRENVLARSGGVCECCGLERYESLHHRTPRGMGGSTDPALNSPANIVAVCGHGTAGCHGKIEVSRAVATEYGWLVPRGQDPGTAPILYRGVWCVLAPGGWVETVAPRESFRLPDPRTWAGRIAPAARG
jgi:hypothetical protein